MIRDCSGGFYFWNGLDHAWNYREPMVTPTYEKYLELANPNIPVIVYTRTSIKGCYKYLGEFMGYHKNDSVDALRYATLKWMSDEKNVIGEVTGFVEQTDGIRVFVKLKEKEKPMKTVKDIDRIVITKNDLNEVLLRAYSGDQIVEKTVAKCSPDDIFDFNIGAKLAVDRLYDGYDMTPKPKRKLYNGKIFIRADKRTITFYSNFLNSETKYVRENKIWEVRDGKIVNMIGRALDTIYDDMTDEELSKLLTRSNSFYVGYYYNIVDGYFVR